MVWRIVTAGFDTLGDEMNASEIFTCVESRERIKMALDIFGGTITRFLDEDYNIVYENRMVFKDSI